MALGFSHNIIMELPKDFQYNRTLGIVASLGVGFLSSIFGIGGGVIHVPLMIYLLGFPVHVATATSHFVLACSSAFGVNIVPKSCGMTSRKERRSQT